MFGFDIIPYQCLMSKIFMHILYTYTYIIAIIMNSYDCIRVFDKIFSLHQIGSFQDIAEPI